MKKLIRKWLQIPNEEDFISKSDLINAVKYAILEAFYPIDVSVMRYFDEDERKNLKGLLEGVISQTVKEKYLSYHEDSLARAKDYVANEDFLDSIITRIKNKQLN